MNHDNLFYNDSSYLFRIIYQLLSFWLILHQINIVHPSIYISIYLSIICLYIIYVIRTVLSIQLIIEIRMDEDNNGLAGVGKEEYQPSLAQSNVKSVISQLPHDHLIKTFKQYQTKSTIIDISQLKSSSYLKLKKYKQSAFYGEIVNGKRHGLGIMIYNNDRIYQGNWECDYKQGLGYQIFPNGSCYQGSYVNGKPEGIGKYTWPNGQFYEGEWINGLKHGSGMWKGVKGDSYVGEWRMGKADGYGVHVWTNGDRYQGYFKQCLKHGQGTQKFANGDLYKGQYAKGKPNGYGQYFWGNGSYFKGNFKNGLRQGHGMWKKSAGSSDKYQGEYIQDKKHGYGIFSWATGNVYKGNYEEDLRTGFGQMYWNDGSYYKGQWKNGIQHGQGLIFVPTTGTKKGLFKDNLLVQIYEQQPLPQLPHQPSLKPGVIHKNYMNKDPNINKLQVIKQKQRQNRSFQSRKKIVSTVDGKNNNFKISKDVKGKAYLPPKPQSSKYSFSKSVYTAELQRVNTTVSNPLHNVPPIITNKRQRIPHSAYYMHKIHKRVSTAHNQSQYNNSRDNMVEQLKNFTRKMVGKPPNRLASQSH